MRGNVVERRPTVGTPDRVREARARRCERAEAESLEHARGAGVPWVRDDERLAPVKRAERLGPFELRRHGESVVRDSRLNMSQATTVPQPYPIAEAAAAPFDP